MITKEPGLVLITNNLRLVAFIQLIENKSTNQYITFEVSIKVKSSKMIEREIKVDDFACIWELASTQLLLIKEY